MWQFRSDSTKMWATAKGIGFNTNTMTFNPVTISRNGYQYRCKITDKHGDMLYSDIATLTVSPSFTILEHPVSVDADADSSIVLSVKAIGLELSYQWEYRSNISELWEAVKGNGSQTDKLTLDSAFLNCNGYQYRCKVTDNRGNILFTNIATLNISSVVDKI